MTVAPSSSRPNIVAKIIAKNLNPAAVVVQDAGVSNHIAAKPHRGTIDSHEDKGRHKCDEEVHSFVRKSFVSESPYRNTSAAYLL